MAGIQGPFDPVVLDLSDSDDYGVLTEALESYAGQLEHEAGIEDQSDRNNGRPLGSPQVTALRESAARARRMLDDVHRQLDANSHARRGG